MRIATLCSMWRIRATTSAGICIDWQMSLEPSCDQLLAWPWENLYIVGYFQGL